ALTGAVEAPREDGAIAPKRDRMLTPTCDPDVREPVRYVDLAVAVVSPPDDRLSSSHGAEEKADEPCRYQRTGAGPEGPMQIVGGRPCHLTSLHLSVPDRDDQTVAQVEAERPRRVEKRHLQGSLDADQPLIRRDRQPHPPQSHDVRRHREQRDRRS